MIILIVTFATKTALKLMHALSEEVLLVAWEKADYASCTPHQLLRLHNVATLSHLHSTT